MSECSRCHKSFEELENWGRINLCKRCAKHYQKTLKAKNNNVDVKIEQSEMIMEACYDHGEHYIGLKKFRSEHRLFTVLNHEYMHHLLNRFIDPRTSFRYDGVSPYGEYDEFAVCDER